MPKLGMEPIRREALIKATIAEIGAKGSLDVTVSQIARRAGVSAALAHHYFGSKEQIFLSAMRHILTSYGVSVRAELARHEAPRDRVEAIIRASFDRENFDPEIVAAWLNFYVRAQSDQGARRLLRIYQRRLRSNLTHELRPLVGDDAPGVAENIGALIDGLYIRHSVGDVPRGQSAAIRVLACLDLMLEETR